jgi:hypothetical protein
MASMPKKSVTVPTKSASMPEENGIDAQKVGNGPDKVGINAGRKWHRCPKKCIDADVRGNDPRAV